MCFALGIAMETTPKFVRHAVEDTMQNACAPCFPDAVGLRRFSVSVRRSRIRLQPASRARVALHPHDAQSEIRKSRIQTNLVAIKSARLRQGSLHSNPEAC